MSNYGSGLEFKPHDASLKVLIHSKDSTVNPSMG